MDSKARGDIQAREVIKEGCAHTTSGPCERCLLGRISRLVQEVEFLRGSMYNWEEYEATCKD